MRENVTTTMPPPPPQDASEVAKAFKDLKASGKVRHLGASNFSPSQLKLLTGALERQKLALTTVRAEFLYVYCWLVLIGWFWVFVVAGSSR